MGIKIITGQSGEQHINSADDGAINIGMIGGGQYVLPTGNKLSCQKISNSIVRINDGIGINQGRFFCIPYGDYEDVTIDNGVAGVKRCDLVVARYSLDADTAIETCEIVLIKGNSGAAYVVPSYIKSNIYEGGKTSDMPLYKIMINGTSIDSIECLFQTIDDDLYSAIKRIASNEEDIAELYNADSDIVKKISDEQIRAEEKESALQDSINAMGENFVTVSERITAESDRAKEAENKLDKKIKTASSGVKSVNGKTADSYGKITLKGEDIEDIIMKRNCCQTARTVQSVSLFETGTTLKIALTSYSDSKKYFDIGTYFRVAAFSAVDGRIYFDRKLTVTVYKPDKTTVLGNITISSSNISKALRALGDTIITGEDDFGYKIYLDSKLNGYLVGPDEEVPPYISESASKLNHTVTFKGNSELLATTDFTEGTEIDIMTLLDQAKLNVNSATSATIADKISSTIEFTGPSGATDVELKKNATVDLSGLFNFEQGPKGDTGQRGSRWTTGTAIMGTSTIATVFSATGITDALVNDMYLNTSTGNVYKCTVAGAASTAKWAYAGCIKGAKGDKGDSGTTTGSSETSTCLFSGAYDFFQENNLDIGASEFGTNKSSALMNAKILRMIFAPLDNSNYEAAVDVAALGCNSSFPSENNGYCFNALVTTGNMSANWIMCFSLDDSSGLYMQMGYSELFYDKKLYGDIVNVSEIPTLMQSSRPVLKAIYAIS